MNERDNFLSEIQTLKNQVSILDAQRSRLGRMAEMMNALSALSTQINSLEAEKIKDLAVSRLPALVRARRAALYGVDEKTGLLILERHSDPALPSKAKPFSAADDTLLSRAVESQDLIVVSDLGAYASVLGEPLKKGPGMEAAERCAILAPLRASQALVGILVLMDKDDDGVLDVMNDVPPVQQASQLLASALRNVQLYQQVMLQSRTDSLTGLRNRRAFWELLEQEVQRSRRYGHALALLLIDVDRFKQINDTHGHREGDAVLTGVAETLQGLVRGVDVVARYGGDEFCALLPETDLPGAKVVGDRFLEKVRLWASPSGTKATLSIGVAGLLGRMTPAELVAAADGALYGAKEAGRNAVAVAKAE